MIKRVCDCCGAEVEEDYFFHGVHVHTISTKLDKDTRTKIEAWGQNTQIIDLCATCFTLYQDKLNRLANDFVNKK